MKNQTHFRPYDPHQLLLLPPDMKQWLPEDDLVWFIRDVVGRLDLDPIVQSYNGALGGQPPYDPRMMVALLIYAYCVGVVSSRKIEQATYRSVPFRVLTADQHPDHDTIAAFRRRHLQSLSGLFVEVLHLCRKVGLVKLGHVALDGTKVRANASKHKAMSYDRMEKKAVQLRQEVADLLEEAEAIDTAEDVTYGKGCRGDELPRELRFRQSRLAKIDQAMKALKEEAQAKAEAERPEYQMKKQDWDDRQGTNRGREPKEPSKEVKPKAQRNFTDPDSRIMKDGATKSFEQTYNCQAAVDETSQVIVAAEVTQQPNDKQQIEPMVEMMTENLEGATPQKLTADSGYYSETNVAYLQDQDIDAYIATGRTKHNDKPQPASRGRIPRGATPKQRMDRKLRTVRGRATYKKRKSVVEPVFGQIKAARGLRAFLLRGLENVRGEWKLICLTHNLLKLFRSGQYPKLA